MIMEDIPGLQMCEFSCLYRYGFGHVWLNQGVGDPIRFIKEFYQRICDCATQEWNTQKSKYSKLALYNEVKTELGYESYLSNINVKIELPFVVSDAPVMGL